MRRRYPLNDVRRMAISQAERSRAGLEPCVQPLIVTPMPDETPSRYLIVAGHLRHAGNVYLKDKAPQLNCIVRQFANDAAMLSEMSAENGLRADISPLGWAEHFRRQVSQGRTLRQICRDSGKSLSWVQVHLGLLELGPVSQALIDTGELPLGVGQYLLQVTPRHLQDTAARQFAKNRSTVAEIKATVEAVAPKRAKPGPKPGAVRTQAYSTSRPATDKLPAKNPATLRDLRKAAQASCSACEISRPLPLAEPAWHLALAAAGETCDCCGLQEAKDACSSCPLVDMLKRVAGIGPR
jgi:ParB-like chromosome segregation protein Spo0J